MGLTMSHLANELVPWTLMERFSFSKEALGYP
jgi:hypothetical protein